MIHLLMNARRANCLDTQEYRQDTGELLLALRAGGNPPPAPKLFANEVLEDYRRTARRQILRRDPMLPLYLGLKSPNDDI